MAANLNKHPNDIGRMERESLFCNPYLKVIFTNAHFLHEQPLFISQVSFRKKTPVEEQMLMPGDSAGLITPLCGNGMSMAILWKRHEHGDAFGLDCFPEHAGLFIQPMQLTENGGQLVKNRLASIFCR